MNNLIKKISNYKFLAKYKYIHNQKFRGGPGLQSSPVPPSLLLTQESGPNRDQPLRNEPGVSFDKFK